MATERTGNILADQALDDYEEAIALAVARALDGQITKRELQQALETISNRFLGMIYTIGGGDLNSSDGQKWLENETKIHKRSSMKLANDVFAGRYSVE